MRWVQQEAVVHGQVILQPPKVPEADRQLGLPVRKAPLNQVEQVHILLVWENFLLKRSDSEAFLQDVLQPQRGAKVHNVGIKRGYLAETVVADL